MEYSGPESAEPTAAKASELGPVIRIRGARTHNLKAVDVDIPRNRLVVLTGVSGSGKSSLAFDTIFAEGQRRYIEGLSSFARQFLDQLEPPDVDLIEGLPPTVAIDQRRGGANPRSTIATITEIHDYLRLLYARTGTPHCPNCGVPIQSQTAEQVVEGVLGLGERRKVILLASLVRGKKGGHLDAFEAIRRAGLIRARVDREQVELTGEPLNLDKSKPHDIEAVIDRLVVREGIRARLADSVDLGLKLGDGTLIIAVQHDDGHWEDSAFSTKLACPQCGLGIVEIEPRTFSFNSPYGACTSCGGLGSIREFDPKKLLTDPQKSFFETLEAFKKSLTPAMVKHVESKLSVAQFLSDHSLTGTEAIATWPHSTLQDFLGTKQKSPGNGCPGLIPTLEMILSEGRERQVEALEAFRSNFPCPECAGSRLRPEARAVTIGDLAIHQLTSYSIDDAGSRLATMSFDPALQDVALPLVAEVQRRLGFLSDVGLGYLTLDRGAQTLSGGELQRARLASHLGSGLVGACFVLDEPTAGLHPRDTDRLLECLQRLRDRGNTVLVVEHDEATMVAADWLIDLGPGAGPLGGHITAEGRPHELIKNSNNQSATLQFLSNKVKGTGHQILGQDRLQQSPGSIKITGASKHNLKKLDVQIPLGTLTAVSGVSGSGKSTLILEVFSPAVQRFLEGGPPQSDSYRSIDGLDQIDKSIVVDQSPIGRTPRSTPATYTGVIDPIRKIFATTREARIRGYGPQRFSYNSKEGRCARCEGLGVRKLEMTFLPDLYVICESCRGLRFNQTTSAIRFKGRSIGEVLHYRVDDAIELFAHVPSVLKKLQSLQEAGLGYLTLGQSSTTLSGGEAQRVKLATELSRPATGRTLYILDEPTTGLHFSDVEKLLQLLHRLANLGNTVVVIEHHPQILREADWLIDLGPEGGEGGGSLVVMGPPSVVAATPESQTGRYL